MSRRPVTPQQEYSLPEAPVGHNITAWRTVAGRLSALHLTRATNLLRGPICRNVRSDNRLSETYAYPEHLAKAGTCSSCWKMACR